MRIHKTLTETCHCYGISLNLNTVLLFIIIKLLFFNIRMNIILRFKHKPSWKRRNLNPQAKRCLNAKKITCKRLYSAKFTIEIYYCGFEIKRRFTPQQKLTATVFRLEECSKLISLMCCDFIDLYFTHICVWFTSSVNSLLHWWICVFLLNITHLKKY